MTFHEVVEVRLEQLRELQKSPHSRYAQFSDEELYREACQLIANEYSEQLILEELK